MWLVVEVHRVGCRRCGVRTERLPILAGKAHYTRVSLTDLLEHTKGSEEVVMSRASLINRLELSDDLEEIYQWFYENEMTDGLPIIPPTEERVERMVRASRHDPEEIIAVIPPRQGVATVEAIAANAVMAGCRPEYMPVLIAAARAMQDPALNLPAFQGTTAGFALLVLINGPIRKALNVNCAGNAWGQGFRANATIGRAVRLMTTTIGGTYPQKSDRSTQGNPGKYSLCIGENEEASPWEPFHVERGFDRNDSTVTLVGMGSQCGWEHSRSNDALDILTTVTNTIPVIRLAQASLIAFAPEHAADVARGGFTKQEVKQFLHEHFRKPVAFLKKLGCFSPQRIPFLPKVMNLQHDDTVVPLSRSPNDFMILVTGGAGHVSLLAEVSGPFSRDPRALQPLAPDSPQLFDARPTTVKIEANSL